VAAGKVPENVKALLMPHIENHERTLKAALTCDEELVVQAFLHDPVVKGKQPQEAQVRSLVHDMIENTRKYLPDGWN
jgi:alpha-galactosidase/6-phospho-beta-glucosidase family protein